MFNSKIKVILHGTIIGLIITLFILVVNMWTLIISYQETIKFMTAQMEYMKNINSTIMETFEKLAGR